MLNKYKKQICAVITIACLTLTACSSTTSVNQSTDGFKTVTVSDTESYTKAALEMIQKGESASEIFVEDFDFKFQDAVPNAKINNWYISSNSLYVQVGTDQKSAYMYRFQFNNDDKIVSYIRYTVEG